ncbi:MAG: hypothetical protein RR614_03995 [Eubacterium sp.]
MSEMMEFLSRELDEHCLSSVYLDAKTDTGRTKRLEWMIERLNKNLKPM